MPAPPQLFQPALLGWPVLRKVITQSRDVWSSPALGKRSDRGVLAECWWKAVCVTVPEDLVQPHSGQAMCCIGASLRGLAGPFLGKKQEAKLIWWLSFSDLFAEVNREISFLGCCLSPLEVSPLAIFPFGSE